MGLICEDKQPIRPSIHGAIYYKLTDFGVYYVIKNTQDLFNYFSLEFLLKDLIKNYEQNILFTTFLYPYIGVQSILYLRGTGHLQATWRYLRDCCNEIDEIIKDVETMERGGEQIFIWEDISPGHERKLKEIDYIRLRNFLKRDYDIDWLDYSDITKSEDNDEIRITYKNKVITIRLDEKVRTRAYLNINRKKMRALNICIIPLEDKTSFIFDIRVPIDSPREVADQISQYRIKKLASNLVFKILSMPFVEKDAKILSSDNKFVKLLETTKEAFNKNCNYILGNN